MNGDEDESTNCMRGDREEGRGAKVNIGCNAMAVLLGSGCFAIGIAALSFDLATRVDSSLAVRY